MWFQICIESNQSNQRAVSKTYNTWLHLPDVTIMRSHTGIIPTGIINSLSHAVLVSPWIFEQKDLSSYKGFFNKNYHVSTRQEFPWIYAVFVLKETKHFWTNVKARRLVNIFHNVKAYKFLSILAFPNVSLKLTTTPPWSPVDGCSSTHKKQTVQQNVVVRQWLVLRAYHAQAHGVLSLPISLTWEQCKV